MLILRAYLPLTVYEGFFRMLRLATQTFAVDGRSNHSLLIAIIPGGIAVRY